MTPERITELRTVAQAATPGPFHQDIQEDEGEYIPTGCVLSETGDVRHEMYDPIDALYVCTFDPATVLGLLDDLEQYREALAWYADEENYYGLAPGEWVDGDTPGSVRFAYENGARARAALMNQAGQ